MKNIFEIMEEFGLEVPEDKQKNFEKQLLENYKTVSDYEVQAKKLETAEGKVKTLTDSLGKFKDVDVDKLNQDIEKLKNQLDDKDKELADQLAERDFMDTLKESVHAAKGKDTEKIIRLLDVEKLKVGQSIYIKAIDTPDYWWDETELQPLETGEGEPPEDIDFSDYFTEESNE